MRTDRQTDRHDETNSRFSQSRLKTADFFHVCIHMLVCFMQQAGIVSPNIINVLVFSPLSPHGTVW